jgi:DNA mismatch endonuclease (patch repair protein)
MARRTPSYKGLHPVSERATKVGRAVSRKSGTRCELALRRVLWSRGLRFRITPWDLPGRPDLIFRRHKVAVFCDGDFWHGRDLEMRLAKLRRGHNAPYWVRKIQTNVERDNRVSAELREAGWVVLRFWEADIARNVERIADEVQAIAAPRVPSRTRTAPAR